MRKAIFIFVALVICASISFAATATIVVKGVSRKDKSEEFRTSSWTYTSLVVTNTRNDTLVFGRTENTFFDQTSLASFFANYRTNNTGADSGDVICKLEIGWDSTAYYVPLADTVEHNIISLAADTLASGIAGTTNYYKRNFKDLLLNDSTLTYTLFTVQPKSVAAGYSLSIPLQWPMVNGVIYPFTTFRLIFSKGAKFKSGDTTWVRNGAITTTDFIK